MYNSLKMQNMLIVIFIIIIIILMLLVYFEQNILNIIEYLN